MPRLPTIAATLALACGPAPADPDPTSSTSTDTSTTDATTTTAPPTTTSDASTTADLSSTTLDFPREPDIFNPFDCDPFMQDCPPGQKCAPYAYGGGTAWNSTKCVDITGDNKPRDPCTAPEGGAAGIDDCALGSLCWDVPDATLEGTCIAQCSGSPSDPICPVKYYCAIVARGDLAVCLPSCDPLEDDCDATQVCLATGDQFTCMLDVSGDEGQANDPCEFRNACDPGLTCLDSEAASSACDLRAQGCCQPFCELPDAPCPNPDQECIPWFAPQLPIPPGYEHLGICALPN